MCIYVCMYVCAYMQYMCMYRFSVYVVLLLGCNKNTRMFSTSSLYSYNTLNYIVQSRKLSHAPNQKICKFIMWEKSGGCLKSDSKTEDKPPNWDFEGIY